jgi:hypothetical protein
MKENLTTQEQKAIENGGQKVPYVEGDAWSGLTKREYFAGLAMQGILAHEAFYQRMANEGNDVMIKEISKASVKMADELLKQLESK